MSQEKKPIVLGQQIADAHANETARLAAGPGLPSPMPKEQYIPEEGHYELTAVSPMPLDDELAKLTAMFRRWDAGSRIAARDSISLDEQYTLIQFAKRSAVLALRESSEARCRDALTALSMLDETRIDPRDAMWAAGIISHAMSATKAGRDALVDQAAAMATPGMSKILEGARKRQSLSSWGQREIRTIDGIGLILSGFARYEPTLNLTELALKIVASYETSPYYASPEIAESLPDVWLKPECREDAGKLLKKAYGCILVRATRRTREHVSQIFFQWVVEMPTESGAAALVNSVGRGTKDGSTFTVGLASGRLFALLVAGSATRGVAPIETPESLSVYAEKTRALLSEMK